MINKANTLPDDLAAYHDELMDDKFPMTIDDAMDYVISKYTQDMELSFEKKKSGSDDHLVIHRNWEGGSH